MKSLCRQEDRKTKRLVKDKTRRCCYDHRHRPDRRGMLIKTKPRLVVNAGDSLSGRYQPRPQSLAGSGHPFSTGWGRSLCRPPRQQRDCGQGRPGFARRLLGKVGFSPAPLWKLAKARLNWFGTGNFVRYPGICLKGRISSWAPFPCRRLRPISGRAGFGGGEGENYGRPAGHRFFTCGSRPVWSGGQRGRALLETGLSRTDHRGYR